MINFDELNNNLADVELMISSHYHFTFPDLTADNIDDSTLMVSILQIRVITEGICRFVVLQEHMVNDEKSIRTATLKVYVNDIMASHLVVPKSIIMNMRTIQGISNNVVHFQVDGLLDKKDAYIALESLENILKWFKERYSVILNKENKWKLSCEMLNKKGSISKKSPDAIIQRNKEAAQIREMLQKEKTILLRGYSGVGKTELAKEYAHKYRKKYDGVYYAENISEIDDYIFNMPIGILDEQIKTKEEIINEKLEIIHTMKLTYLFIIDNYTGTVDELNCLYPENDNEYHLMIIVNEDNHLDWKFKVFDVETFNIEESLQIFQHFCGREYDQNEINHLLEHIKYNPRAIKMCALFLQENDTISISGLIKGISDTGSVKDIMKSLYMALFELSILEEDINIRIVSECLSILPYSGVSITRFQKLMLDKGTFDLSEQQIGKSLEWLLDSGWIFIDQAGYISINPLLSDTIFDKLQPDLTTASFKTFILEVLKPVKESRNLYLDQIVTLKPFVEILMKRVVACKSVDWEILNELREYYIAIYDIEKIKELTDIMEREFENYNQRYKADFVENAIYRQGISRFNLEDFEGAHPHFEKALNMLYQKKITIEKDIARISAYEGAALAALGDGKKAIELEKNSIGIREKLALSGDMVEEKNLWISHYNYAKVLMYLEQYAPALDECDVAIHYFEKGYPTEYEKKSSTNVSSLLQLKGRILCGLEQKDPAITLLEEAKDIREALKGKAHFASGQLYSYLMDTYAHFGLYEDALSYAVQYRNILVVQHKTAHIQKKIVDVEEKITIFMEKVCND